MDGRTITVPLLWYPRLFGATEAQRSNWQVSAAGYGIHWPDVDEDLSTEGLTSNMAVKLSVRSVAGVANGARPAPDRRDFADLMDSVPWLGLPPP